MGDDARPISRRLDYARTRPERELSASEYVRRCALGELEADESTLKRRMDNLERDLAERIARVERHVGLTA